MEKKVLQVKNIESYVDNPYMNLDKIFRYSNTKLMESESDLVHVGRMIYISMFIIDDLRNYYKSKLNINEDDLYSRIIHHDLTESACCDIPRDFKYHSKELHDLIEKTSFEKLEESGVPDERLERIKNAKDDGTIEAEITAFVDMLQCVLKLRNEYLLQNNEIIHKRYIESLQNTIKNLDKRINSKACECIKERLIYYKSIFEEEIQKKIEYKSR